MIRPMCGSSSATSACRMGMSVTSDQGRDVFAIAPKFVEQLADVGLRPNQDEEDGVGTEDRDDRESVAMLEDRRRQRSARRGAPQLVGRSDDRRNSRREIL